MRIKILISYFGIALFKFLSFRFMDFVGFFLLGPESI